MQRRRIGIMRHGEIETDFVEPVGCDAGLDEIGDHIERFGSQTPGLAHAGETLLTEELDFARAATTCLRRINKGHGRGVLIESISLMK